MSAPTFSVACGSAGKSNYGRIIRQQNLTPDQLGNLLRKSQAQTTDLLFEDYELSHTAAHSLPPGVERDAAKDKVDRFKDAPWFSCARYTGNRRRSAAVESVTAFAGDADKKVTRNTLMASLDSLGCAYIAATSTSHGCGGRECWRVIIPLVKPIDPALSPDLWTHMNALLGGVLDPGAKDSTRLNYLPRVPTGATGHDVIVVSDRTWFDTETVKSKTASNEDAGIKKTPTQHALQQQPGPRSIDELRKMLERVPVPPDEKTWWPILRAIHFESRGSEEGLMLADEWSRLGLNYGGIDPIRSKWESPAWNDATSPSFTSATLLQHSIAALTDFPVDEPCAEPVALSPLKVRTPFLFRSLPSDVLEVQIMERIFAIFPYFPRRTVSFLLSIGAFGKSHLLLLISICKALGLPHFTRCSCTPGRVVILTAEDDYEEVQRRAQKVLRYLTKRGAVIDHELLHANLHIVDLTGLGAGNFLVKSEREGTAITSLSDHIAAQIGTAEIIAIDTQSRFSGAPENDNTAGAAFVSACESIAQKTGASVIVLAHTGKQVAREGIVDQYSSRGASSLSDNARSVVVLAPLDKASIKQFEMDANAVANGEIFRLVHVKSNYAKKAADAFLERREDGVVAPYTPWPRASVTEDDLAAKLIAYVGLREIRPSDVRSNFSKIFGTTLTRDKAMEVFEHTKDTGWLTYVRTYNQAEHFKVDLSLKAARAALISSSPHYNLVLDFPECAT